MATRKNNWLNAKPVTRIGGKSGGARNPAKPYSKPPAKPKPKPPAKPQSKPNSRATAPASNTRPGGGVTMPNSRRAGVNLPKAGVRAERAATGAMQPRSPMPKAVTKPTVKPPSTVRRAGGGLVAGTLLTTAAAKALDTLGKAAKPSEWKRVQKELKDRGYGSGNKPNSASARGSRAGAAAGTRTRSRNTAKPTSALEGRVSNANINDLRRGQEEARKAQLERANRGQRSTTQSGGGSTQSRSSSSSRSMPSAVTRSTAPARDAGMKNQDPKYRGNLFEKTFGYKKGEAPDQQKSRFKSVDNKFGQDSGYEPKTKVDGSRYSDKKPDMKKVKEYDRLRRRYYD